MEEDIDVLRAKLLNEVNSTYPSERSEIQNRYSDTAFVLFKRSRPSGHRGSFLSFGSRRSSVVSSYGNTPTIMRRSVSSNGILEYGVEQVPPLRIHALPFITKEEKEMEGEDEGKEADKSVEKQKYVIPPPSKNADKNESIPESKDNSEKSVESDFRNRKIFQHYDVPPVRKLSNPQKSSENLSNRSNINEAKAEASPCIKLNLTKQFTDNSSKVNEGTLNNDNLNTELNGKAEGEVLPKILGLTSSKNKELVGKNENEELPLIKKKKPAYLLSNPEGVQFQRTVSLNEKNASISQKNSVVRLSLRDLPHRSPTPPKRSPRKVAKNFKDGENIEHQPKTASNTECVEFSSSLEINVSNTLPPLISSQEEVKETNFDSHKHSSFPSVNSQPIPTESLDNTTLLIVEENDEIPLKSPISGIHNLASDRQVNTGFIVVHPSNESNSLGLAPISTPEKSSLHSSKNSSSQKLSSGRRSYSKANQTSISRLMSKKFTEKESSSSSSSQVTLVKFSKSNEDYVSSVTSKKSVLSNYRQTKGCIRSLPFDNNWDITQSSYGKMSTNFVNTNSSRLCVVM